MDKKKVIKLIGNIENYLLAYKKSGKVSDIAMALQQLHEAEGELSKSDWISVEDGLPPYGEDVVVCNKEYNPNIKWVTRRVKEKVRKDIWDFYLQSYDKPRVTHWHKIDKLEV